MSGSCSSSASSSRISRDGSSSGSGGSDNKSRFHAAVLKIDPTAKLAGYYHTHSRFLPQNIENEDLKLYR